MKIRKIALLLVLQATFVLTSFAQKETQKEKATAEQLKPKGEHHEFVITNFKTESGVTLPKARVVYGTYGQLNAARDNVVLLPSHYMADHHGYEWLIGPELRARSVEAVPRRDRAVRQRHSSSPSNTPEPFHGPRFPVMTIRDNVEAVHRLLADELKVTHVRAIIGFSMGAEQAFQWAVSYPAVRRSHRRDVGHGEDLAARHRAARGPDRRAHRRSGVQRRRLHGAAAKRDRGLRHGLGGWLYSQEWWRRELWRERPVAWGHARGSGRITAARTSSRRRRQRPDPAGAHLGAARRRHDARLQRRRRAGACGRSQRRCSTCRRKPTSTSRSATRGTRRIHPARHARADSVVVGTPRRRRAESGGQ